MDKVTVAYTETTWSYHRSCVIDRTLFLCRLQSEASLSLEEVTILSMISMCVMVTVTDAAEVEEKE
jgi:hypothetical protein